MLSRLVKQALFVVKIAWIQALLTYGAAPFIYTGESWPYYQFEMDSVETVPQHEMPTDHTSTIPSSPLHFSAQDYYSPAWSMFSANDEWFEAGMPSPIFELESSASSSVQLVKAIHPMYLGTQHPSQDSSRMSKALVIFFFELVQELTSNYDDVATSIPNELKTYSSELKRKIFNESEDSPSTKLKQPVDKIDVKHSKGDQLTFKPNDDIAGPLSIYRYAFLSILNFPSVRYGWINHDFYGQVLRMSHLWKSLHGEGLRLPPLIESLTRLRDDTKSKTTIISKAISLLAEIFHRDSQFLVALTSSESSNRSQEHP
ncbi:hypothetical protein VP01_4142g2 [Puccinia sorghi]|uniref:Uncharacterized protein n=1 Tax=Puccinia sorghi TaxID=27349 RepID=A0A0L6UR32_9BASI|nr:hypothetical protein VP01_4142g2 [Puccinia sorghi]